jgi:copper chaperone
MLEFKVQDMTCGHCVSSITKAVQQADPDAKVEVELERHAVRVSNAADPKRIEEAIRDAGYSPVPQHQPQA